MKNKYEAIDFGKKINLKGGEYRLFKTSNIYPYIGLDTKRIILFKQKVIIIDTDKFMTDFHDIFLFK